MTTRSMPTSSHVPVLVVGAGPTGATAALELAGRGIEVLVVDRWRGVYPQPRAVHLDDEMCRALARLGVGPQFAAISRAGCGLRVVDSRFRVLGEFRRDPMSAVSGFPCANMFDQPELEQILRTRLADSPLVTLREGAEVVGLQQPGVGPVRAIVRDVVTTREVSLSADVVLGCDGANSFVRTAIGSSLRNLGFEQRWLVVDVDTDADLGHWDGVHQICSSVRAGTYMRVGRRRHRWEFRLLDKETSADYRSLAQLHPLLRPWLGPVPASALRLIRTAEYCFRAAVADRWRAGRVFLLGDAAHLTPPFIGQGLGAGVRDSVNLAWKVAGVLDGSLAGDVLDTYEVERSAHAQAMVRLAMLLGRAMTSGGRTGDVLRRCLVPGAQLLPAVRRQVSDSATPPLVAAFLPERLRQGRLAGHLVPNGRVGGVRLDEVVGRGWCLVTRARPAPSDEAVLGSLGCIVVPARPGGDLDTWLVGARATAALVRPDRTVLASGHDVSALCARLTSIVAPTGEHNAADDQSDRMAPSQVRGTAEVPVPRRAAAASP